MTMVTAYTTLRPPDLALPNLFSRKVSNKVRSMHSMPDTHQLLQVDRLGFRVQSSALHSSHVQGPPSEIFCARTFFLVRSACTFCSYILTALSLFTVFRPVPPVVLPIAGCCTASCRSTSRSIIVKRGKVPLIRWQHTCSRTKMILIAKTSAACMLVHCIGAPCNSQPFIVV